MKQFTIIVLCFVVCVFNAFAQTGEPRVNRDPKKAKFVTSDIDNFWRAFDLASKEQERIRKIAVYQTEYLDKGSAGLRDFVRLRIKSANAVVEIIEKQSRYFASIRSATLRVADTKKKMQKSFRSFKKLYAEAVFPDVYFLIGISNTGGTTSENGLLIGTEMYGLTANTPYEELPDWMKPVLKPIEEVPPTVAHELIHFNQQYSPKTLLGQSIKEGAADFLGEMISGEKMSPRRHVYGDAHEAELWREFQTEMNGMSFKNWMYNGLTVKDKPTDLGYYMGYKICESYYRNAKDKKQAIRDILEIKDFAAFLEKSDYRKKFAE